MKKEKIIEFLIEMGRKEETELTPPIDFFRYLDKNEEQEIRYLDKNKKEKIKENEIREANRLLNDLENYPHAFVLACVMDRGIKAEKAWLIPYKVLKELGGFEFKRLISKTEKIQKFFRKEKPHRFYKKMATNFCSAILKINDDYEGDASKIWKKQSWKRRGSKKIFNV